MSASELRHSEERRLHEQQEESSTLLWLINRLKDMEESFRSTRNTVQVRCQELEDRERQVGDHSRKLDVLKAEAEKRAVELRGLEKLIQEKRKEAVEGESHLDSLKIIIQEHKEELEIKEKRLSDVERMIGLKEGECESFEKRMKEGLEKLSRVEREIEEKTQVKQKLSRNIEVKGKVLCLQRTSMEEWSRKLEAKGRDLEELSKKIELKEKQFEPRVEEIQLIEKRVNECLGEIEVKERYLQSIEKSIQEREKSMEEWSGKLEAKGRELEELSEKIELKEKQFEPRLNEIVLKESYLQSLEKSIQEREKSMEEWSGKLEAKGRELEELSEKIELKEKQFEPRLNEIVLKESYLQSLEKSIQEREKSLEDREKLLGSISDGLEMREKEIDRKAKEHELKKYEAAPESNALPSLIEVGKPESFLVNKTAVLPSSNRQSSESFDASHFQGRGSGNDVLGNQSFANLQSSLDPAKLVLDWMQSYLSQYWTKGDVGFEVASIKTYISLLEQLMRVSPHGRAQLKVHARRLSVQWKVNLRAVTENSLEILGFLHFIATFGLLNTLSVDEMVKLLAMICQHKEALELCQAVGFADKIPEFIRTLVERKQLMEALRLICTFKLMDKFPPRPLLEEYMKEEIQCCRDAYKSTKLHNEKVRIVDDQITSLRSAISMIKDHNLDSEYASTNIETQIRLLHSIKNNWRLQLGNLQTLPKRGTKRSSETLLTTFEPSLQQPNKLHRTAVAAIRPPATHQRT